MDDDDDDEGPDEDPEELPEEDELLSSEALAPPEGFSPLGTSEGCSFGAPLTVVGGGFSGGGGVDSSVESKRQTNVRYLLARLHLSSINE